MTRKNSIRLVKKYKLASSEGLNKHTNRMIRYNVMKDFLFGLTDELEKHNQPYLKKCKLLQLIM